MPASHPATFLSGENRQVWALRRDTGEPVYLEVGGAEALREFTKTNLRCPYPGCTARISTRGGSKRDHFFHVSTAPHETGRESEFHLAGKAMLAQWLAERLPDGATVREEQTVKNPETALYRRPDVLATGKTGRRVAFEVEYKSWAVDAWEHKQAELDAAGIICLWLFGHTRVRLVNSGVDSNEVVVPALVAEVAKRGVPVLLVSPVTREIGTLTNRRRDERFDGSSRHAWLQVDALDECRFSSIVGLRTPSMVVIEEAERRRVEVEAARGERRERWESVWEQSPIRAAFIERWGGVPDEFEWQPGDSRAGRSPRDESGIAAVDAHWRAVIYEDLIHEKKDAFRWRRVIEALRSHGIEIDTAHASAPLHDWMRYLARLQLILMKDRRKRYAIFPVWEFTPSGRTFDQTRDELLRDQRLVEERRAAREEAALERTTDLESRRRTKVVLLEDGSKRWVPKCTPDSMSAPGRSPHSE